MDDAPLPGGPEPGLVKYLRRLVTVLTVTMVGGVVVLIALVVIRLQPPPLVLPETLVLPEGERPQAFTQGRDWIAVVTESDLILIYDRQTGTLRQTLTVAP